MTAALAGVFVAACAASPFLIVDPHSVVPDADGSRAKPFRTIGAALQAARDGDTVDLGIGLYTERVVVAKKVTLRGGKAAVIASPDATGTVVELEVPASLEHLAVQGGEVGVRAADGSRLSEVDCSAQRRAGVLASGSVEVRGGKLSALFDRKELTGIEVEPGGSLAVVRTRFDGPFRWAVLGRQSRVVLREIDVEGAVGGAVFLEGSRGSIVGAVLGQGRETAIVAKASKLEVRDSVLSRWERGIDAFEGAEVAVEDCAAGFFHEAGLTAQGGSELTVRNLLYVGPASLAAIASIGSSLRVEGGVLFQPGATGVAVHGGRGEIAGTLIRGARSDSEGDAVYLESADVEVRQVTAEECSGNGLTVVGGKAAVFGLEAFRVQGAGIRVENAAMVRLEGAEVLESGTGLSVVGGGEVAARFDRFVKEGVPTR